MLLAELTKDLAEETTAIDCPRSGGACYYLCSVTLTKMVVLLGQKDGSEELKEMSLTVQIMTLLSETSYLEGLLTECFVLASLIHH